MLSWAFLSGALPTSHDDVMKEMHSWVCQEEKSKDSKTSPKYPPPRKPAPGRLSQSFLAGRGNPSHIALSGLLPHPIGKNTDDYKSRRKIVRKQLEKY